MSPWTRGKKTRGGGAGSSTPPSTATSTSSPVRTLSNAFHPSRSVALLRHSSERARRDGGGAGGGGAARHGPARRRRLVDLRPQRAAPGRGERKDARLPLPGPGPRPPRRRPLLLRRHAAGPGGHGRPHRDGGLPPGARRRPPRAGLRRRYPAPLGRLPRYVCVRTSPLVPLVGVAGARIDCRPCRIYAGDRELAMLLLHRGADVGAANPWGTALHVAASWAHPEVVAVLLRHGADVCMSGRFCMPIRSIYLATPLLTCLRFCSRTRLRIASSRRWSRRSSAALWNA